MTIDVCPLTIDHSPLTFALSPLPATIIPTVFKKRDKAESKRIFNKNSFLKFFPNKNFGFNVTLFVGEIK
ncbi:MAG: hypothetical protein K8H86_12575 [Ignavibacteriaceae bacterium]|nr:hypothetical protein [Ignavibacteriaceae bacterium]